MDSSNRPLRWPTPTRLNRLTVMVTGLRPRKLLVIPMLAALLLTAVAAGQANATLGPAGINVGLDDDSDLAYSAPGAGLAECDGGAHRGTFVKMNDQPTAISRLMGAPANFVTLPGARVTFNVPAGNTNQVLVLFTAEARLHGYTVNNAFVVPASFLQVRILLDGVPMTPLNDLMFTTDVGQASGVQACRRVGHLAAGHVLEVQWLLVDQPANNLDGTLDDWLLRVELNA